MSNTVKMKKGNKTYDIFNSPETIANAEKEGLTLVKEEPKTLVKEEPLKEEKKVSKVETVTQKK